MSPPPKEIPYPSKGSGICHLGIGSWEFGMSPGPRIGIFGVWNSLSCRHMTPAGAGETFSRNLPASSSPKRELIVSNVLMGYHQLGRWTLVTAEDTGVNPTGRHSHESYKRDHTRCGFWHLLLSLSIVFSRTIRRVAEVRAPFLYMAE